VPYWSTPWNPRTTHVAVMDRTHPNDHMSIV
jgi:hypothetical protein